jgi:hypothetical protein
MENGNGDLEPIKVIRPECSDWEITASVAACQARSTFNEAERNGRMRTAGKAQRSGGDVSAINCSDSGAKTCWF